MGGRTSTSWRNGQSGNPGGRPKSKPFADALRMEIKAAGEDHKLLRTIARALLDKAKAGDMQAIREVADRLDGKPVPQQPADETQAHEPTARPQGVNPYAEMAKQYLVHVKRPAPDANKQA